MLPTLPEGQPINQRVMRRISPCQRCRRVITLVLDLLIRHSEFQGVCIADALLLLGGHSDIDVEGDCSY